MLTKILIIDDHPAACEGLTVRISAQRDMTVCGQAAGVAEAMRVIASARPDVAVVDIQLKDGNGLELVERIRDHDHTIKVLVWSMYPDALYARRAIQAGALGYINKGNTTGRIVDAIRTIREGRIYLADETAQRILGQAFGGNKVSSPAGVEALSDRELEVFRLIGQALSTSEIAKRLRRSSHTVESHRQAIKRKLNLSTAGELHRAAVRWNLQNG